MGEIYGITAKTDHRCLSLSGMRLHCPQSGWRICAERGYDPPEMSVWTVGDGDPLYEGQKSTPDRAVFCLPDRAQLSDFLLALL